jgi:hypothetical protein
LMPIQRRATVMTSGARSRNQSSLVSGDIEWTGVPVRRCSPRPCGVMRSRSAWSVARSSAQVIDGVSGRPPASRAIRVCIAEPNATADTSNPASREAVDTSRTASITAARIVAGSCTASPGCGSSSGYCRRAAAWETQLPSRATTFVAVVPMSMPRTTSWLNPSRRAPGTGRSRCLRDRGTSR